MLSVGLDSLWWGGVLSVGLDSLWNVEWCVERSVRLNDVGLDSVECGVVC